MSMETSQALPILVVLHQEHSTSGRVGRLLRSQGFALDIRRPRFGDPLPATLRHHAGTVIFGGPMSANDDDDWIRREIDWIGIALREEKPFLGICLGAQMLARHLGQRVFRHPEGRVEVGYYPIRPTQQAHALCGTRFPDKVYQWHREGFDLPCGATLLAEGDAFAAQAFRYGKAAFALQFHPEVTYAMMCRWTMDGHERMGAPGAHARHLHLGGWFQHDRPVAQWCDDFLRTWSDGGGACADQRPIRIELLAAEGTARPAMAGGAYFAPPAGTAPISPNTLHAKQA